MKLRFDSVCARYGAKDILHDVCFDVQPGSITALIGRNGAGKSTLLHCLTGEKRDYSGIITLDGIDVRSLRPQALALRAACLPQVLPRPRVTVWELSCFGRAPYTSVTGTLSPQDRQKAAAAIEAAGLSGMERRFADELSGGERKKAFFAMTLAQDTPLMVLDEPTAHLDTASRFEFLSLLDKQRQAGKTILVIMHDIPDVLRCADQIVALHKGRVVFDGTPQALVAEQIPQRYFGIRITGDPVNGYAAAPI